MVSFSHLARLGWQSQEDLVYIPRMMRFLIVILALLMMGAMNQCSTTAVVVPQGPVAAQLSAEKDKQIAGLVAQVKAEQEARLLEQNQASLVAANLEGILFAAEHVPIGLPRNAIEEEAKLGKERSPPANPAELLKAKDRVIAILNGEVEKAKALYGAAFDEAKQAKEQIAAKDREIAERDTKIRDGEMVIAKLTKDAQIEREKHAEDIKKALAAKDAEIKRIKDEAASKERATWVLWTRIVGLAFIVIGAVIAIVLKIIPEGAAFVGVGVLIGLISIFIDWITQQVWFPWLCGGIILAVLSAGGYALYRLWKKKELHAKMTAALQDLKDESVTLGQDTWEKVSDHLKYRLGSKDSAWGKEQAKEVVNLGLVDPKGEEALKAVSVIPEAPKS